MKHKSNSDIWWGPPRKFDPKFKERKISWLELFNDLVYVIAISTITSYLARDLSFVRFLDYFYMFSMAYWGWLNGSLHHDLHGNTGLRTKLMIFWQILFIAAIIITLQSPPQKMIRNVTFALGLMQLFITYLWNSVGYYNHDHRKYIVPYTICYLISFVLMMATFFVPHEYVRMLFYLSLFLNYFPPYLASIIIKDQSEDFSFSDSMTERLGLFTIIIFGELVLGVINGIVKTQHYDFATWLNCALALIIVFMLWWIFFSMIGDKSATGGFKRSSIMSMLYIPTLMSLGILGAVFSKLFAETDSTKIQLYKNIFGISISVYLAGAAAIMQFLKYSSQYNLTKSRVQRNIIVAICLFLMLNFIPNSLSLSLHLFLHVIILALSILIVSQTWYVIELGKLDMGNYDE